jgi:flagellar biosynthesis protein FlgN
MNSALSDPAHGLIDEQQTAHQLLLLLQREQTQLVAADIEGLVELSAEKNALVAKMATLCKGRYTALAAAAHRPDENGMQAWLAQGQHHAVRQLWNDLLKSAESAKELNRTNGLLIAKHMTRNQAALNILHSGTSAGNFYGPDGQSRLQSSGHRLIAG